MVDAVVAIADALATSQTGSLEDIDEESAAYDCSAHPGALTIGANRSVGADCKGKDQKAISEGENRP
jgi:hypothetical protein